jgi:hypothetical protein
MTAADFGMFLTSEKCSGSAACGSTDRDAEGLEKVLAGVSIRHEDVRGDGERQSSGLPVS